MTPQLTILITHSILILSSLFLGIVTYFHDKKSATNVILFILLFSTVVWGVANAFSFLGPPEQVLLWIRVVMVSAVWLTFFFFLFVSTFPYKEIQMGFTSKVAFWSFFAAANILAPFVFNYIDPALTTELGAPFPKPHPVLMLPWGIVVVGIILLALFVIGRKYFRAEHEERKQWAAIFIGMVLTFTFLTLTQYITVVIFKTSIFNSYGPLSYLPMIFGLAYAIFKHHLFNVKAVATEFLTFALWFFLLGRIFFATEPTERLIDISLLAVVIIIGIFLIRSVLNEVRQREALERLTSELDKANLTLQDLNGNLQEKVEEQTVEIRKAYEVEKKARQDLEALDRAKDQFILTTQHHLRTPLTVVKGYIELLLTKPPQAFEKITTDYLTKADSAIERMTKLINEFLGISQLRVGKSILTLQEVSLLPIVQEVFEELHSEVGTKQLIISYTHDPEAWPVVVVDAKKIKEALYVLADNAVRYNKTGGFVTIATQVKNHPIEKNRHLLQVSFQDSGIGITREDLARLFTGFFERGEEAEKIYTTGRGIGLSLARSIIQAHQGRIWAESQGKDSGSTFYIELPLKS